MAFTFNFTEKQLAQLLPRNKDVHMWYEALYEILPYYRITTPERVAAFISQCAHESLEFTVLEENLNYSASALNRVFPKYFKNAGRDANEYHRQPERIANIVYANRMDNGSEYSGDGWKYRGRGAIQLTGKRNYTKFADSLSLTMKNTLRYIVSAEGAIEAACWFWKENGLNLYADAGDVVGLTKRINGGTHGLEDRQDRYEHALEVFGMVTETESTIVLRTVRKGDRNDTVKLVQESLGLTADGIFGPGTEKAVKRWQKEHGLVADGICGPKTLSLMLK